MSDDFDDVEMDDDFDEEEKPTLKDIWDNNPFLKIGALVLGVVIIYFAYTTFLGSADKKEEMASSVGGTQGIESAVGEKVDPYLQKAMEEDNQRKFDAAMQMGESVMPTPIGTVKDSIDAPDISVDIVEDPLEEWRNNSDQRRIIIEEEFDEGDAFAEGIETPNVVPFVAPVRPQAMAQVDEEMADNMASQMEAIIASKSPESSEVIEITAKNSYYSQFLKDQEELESLTEEGFGDVAMMGSGGESDMGGSEEGEEEVLIQAGTILYGRLLNNLNSDIQGPALLQILSGPLSGGRALGSFTRENEYLVLTFTSIEYKKKSYPIDGIAMDQETTLTGLQGDVDQHLMSRVILPAASEFLTGMMEAIADRQGTSVTSGAGGETVEEKPEIDTDEQVAAGASKATEKFTEFLEDQEVKEITVTVDRGTMMGLLLMQSVMEEEE